MVVLSILSETNCMSRNLEFLCLYAPRSCMFFVNRADDDTTTLHGLSQGDIAKLTEQRRRRLSGGLPHLRNYDFVYIVKTNIPLRFKENIIIFSIFITLIAGLRNQIVKYT